MPHSIAPIQVLNLYITMLALHFLTDGKKAFNIQATVIQDIPPRPEVL